MTSSSVDSTERDILRRLRNFGRKLPHHLDSDHKLLEYLDKLELVLSIVEQNPGNSLKQALVPSMKALVSEELLRHPNEDVKISVTACLTEVLRITAPDAPYDDEPMKEILKLIVEALEKLSHVSGSCYEKALTIVSNVSTYRIFLIILDLYCDDMIVEMFRHFLRIIRSNHSNNVIDSMEQIMTMTLNESDEISLDLLIPLLECVKKESQTLSPISWKLGEKVITNCAVKLKPYLMKAVESSGRVLDDYAEIVTSICQNQSESLETNHLLGFKVKTQLNSETQLDTVMMRKRWRKPNSLMTPEEGYDHSLISLRTSVGKSSLSTKMESNFCEENGKHKFSMIHEVVDREEERFSAQREDKKMRSQNATSNKVLNNSSDIKVPESQDLGNSFVGKRIKIWWPLDMTYYEGVVYLYDAVKGKHMILYDDGEVELLNLKRELWKLVDDNVSPDKEQGLVLQKLADASDI